MRGPTSRWLVMCWLEVAKSGQEPLEQGSAGSWRQAQGKLYASEFPSHNGHWSGKARGLAIARIPYSPAFVVMMVGESMSLT
jgi:hypothetical protein